MLTEFRTLSSAIIGKDLTVRESLTARDITTQSVQFDISQTNIPETGQLIWNAEENTLRLGLNNDVDLDIGEENIVDVKATEIIKRGQCVYASGAVGGGSGHIEVSLYKSQFGFTNEIYFLCVAAQDLNANDFGYATTFGKIREVLVSDTRGSDDPQYGLSVNNGWEIGTILYPSVTDLGKYTQTRPSAPNRALAVAMIIGKNGDKRIFYVRSEHGYDLSDLHDIKITNPQDKQILTYNKTLSTWENKSDITVTSLSATTIHALSSFVEVIDIKQYELSGFNVKGDATVEGRVGITDITSAAAGSGSLSGSALNIAQTWNTTGTPTAIKLNVTDTASAAGSLLMDLRVGGVSKVKVDKNGNLIYPQTATGIWFSDNAVHSGIRNNVYGLAGFEFVANASRIASVLLNGINFANGKYIGFRSDNSLHIDSATRIYSDADHVIAQRNGTNAQEFRLYNTYTDASNYERGYLKWDSNELKIGTEAAGTGAARIITLRYNNSAHIAITSSQVLFNNSGQDVDIRARGSDNTFYFHCDAALKSVGIGTSSPSSKLDILDTTLAGSGALAGSILNLAQTWNTTGTPTAIKLDVTDTASNANSLLMDLRVGGSSVFNVNKLGVIIGRSGGLNSALTPSFGNWTTGGELRAAGLRASGTLRFGGSAETILVEDGINNTLAQRNSTNPQTFRLYNTYTDASNYERLSLKANTGGAYEIRSEAAGTGSGRPIQIYGQGIKDIEFGYNYVYSVNISPFGMTNDLGQVSNRRWRMGYFQTLNLVDTVLAGSAALSGSALDIAQTWNTTGTPTAIKLDVTDTASNASSLLMDLQVGGSSKFRIDKSGDIQFSNTSLISEIGTSGVRLVPNYGQSAWRISRNDVPNNTYVYMGYHGGFREGVWLTKNGQFGWGSSSTTAIAAVTTPELVILRDAANTLAQRNGTNPQIFRLYNTYTDSSNYERGFLKWNSNVLEIGTEAAGTGVVRNINFVGGNLSGTHIQNLGTGDNPEFTGIRIGSGQSSQANTINSNIYLNLNINGAQRFGVGGTNISYVNLNPNTNNARSLGTSSLRWATVFTVNLDASGDIEATTIGNGVIIKSPDGTRWRITVDNTGALTTTAI